MDESKVKKIVRNRYAKVAKTKGSCCASNTSCCSAPNKQVSKMVGYSEEEMSAVPEGANLGLGCGNPTALASLKEGERVLDLGSGAGFDCFLAAKKVGEKGKVIGVDMTPEMLEKAKENAQKGSFSNVEFRLGEIENLPVADGIIDIIISNCVINLAPDKDRVFSEALRVLKPGGRIMVSDIVLTKELPDFIKNNMAAYVGCISGAIIKDNYLNAIKKAGFRDVKIIDEVNFPLNYIISDDTAAIVKNELSLSENQAKDLEDSIISIKVYALKPKR